jgi:hypothetical protein|tara:strand:- start:2308 stop:2535 length:228 start_codon:yes stop_codon:yes gene_type:complete
MKIGDLVKLSSFGLGRVSFHAGLIVEFIEKKCWRTDVHGKLISWATIDPEPHAVVLVNGATRTIPVTDLQLIDER